MRAKGITQVTHTQHRSPVKMKSSWQSHLGHQGWKRSFGWRCNTKIPVQLHYHKKSPATMIKPAKSFKWGESIPWVCGVQLRTHTANTTFLSWDINRGKKLIDTQLPHMPQTKSLDRLATHGEWKSPKNPTIHLQACPEARRPKLQGGWSAEWLLSNGVSSVSIIFSQAQGAMRTNRPSNIVKT